MRLGLGTAQFGMDYGVSNEIGRTAFEELVRILALARERGVWVIDTAPSYGNAETSLGEAGVEGMAIVTKTPGLPRRPLSVADADYLQDALNESLERLRLPRLQALLAHAADDLLAEGGEVMWRRMERLRDEGLVAKIGVSVYSAQQLDGILERYRVQVVQLPLSVFDQRLLRDGRIAGLRQRGIEVHVRSVFLQGLLLMDPGQVPVYFAAWREVLRDYRLWLADRCLSPLSAALGFALGLQDADVVFVGVNSAAHLEEACSAEPLDTDDFGDWAMGDADLLDPSRWRL